MKKIFYLASIAALAFSSCAKDETTGVEIQNVGGSKIVAAVEADDTRTELIKGEAGYEFRWKATDALYVYGDEKHPLPGETFAISEGAESASAVFSGVALKSDAKYVATYPAKTSVKPTWDKLGNGTTVPFYYEVAPASVKMSIPAEQNYKPGSFDTGVAPAVSTTFAVDAEGNAQVSMQPVADYLFVNIRGTEPIEKLTLRLTTAEGKKQIGLAGEAALVKYTQNKTTRYYLPNTGMKGDITLNAIATPDVDCHDANTYVFTIPAGILGMGNSVCAYLFVNEAPNANGSNWRFAVTDYEINKQYLVNKEMHDNYLINQYKGKNEAGKTVDMNRGYDSKKATAEKPMENTVFWLNEMVDTDADGEVDARGSFLYNPDGATIITDQIELLNYLENYKSGDSAFICNDAEFDFSKEALDALATEYRKAGYTFVNDLINNYYAFGFPCIKKFEDSFVGNGAVISNVAKLRSMDGIFGEIAGTVSGVTFENIISAKDVDVVNKGLKNEYEVTTYGVILGSNKGKGTVKKVVISGGSGEAVMDEATSADYAGITFENISEDLNNIFNNVAVAAATQAVPAFDLSSTWAEVSNVAGSVFENVTPAGRAIINIDNEDATYAKLTDKVVNGTTPNVASVLINGVSYWTGGKTPATADFKVNKIPYGKYIQYAEELAYGLTSGYAVLTRNMDLNFENLQWYDEDGDLIDYISWETANFNILEGAGNTVKGIVMFDSGATKNDANHSVAPFKLNVAQNITLDGVEINLVSKQDNTYVPQWIAGLSISASEISGVTLNNLEIVAGDADEQNAPQYNTNGWKAFMGYLVANATDIKVSNTAINGVYSNVKGTAAPVAHLEVTSTNAQMLNNTLTNVELDGGQTEITECTEDAGRKLWNISSETFGRVWGHGKNANTAVGIKFDGYSNIAFTYNAESPIVIYDLDSTDDNVVLENE